MRGMGTPEYAPLEQYDASAGHTDQRSDLYGLGATLYHALTGRAPPTITSRILDPGALTPPRVDASNLLPSTEAAILRAMEVHPVNRFASAEEMRSELSRGLAGRPAVAAPTPAPARAARDRGVPQSPPKPILDPSEQARGAKAAPPLAELPPAVKRASTLTVVSLVLGIVSLASLMCYGVGGLVGIAALVTGVLSRRHLKGSPESRKGARMALAGIVTGIISIVAAVCFLGILVLGAVE